MTRFYNLGDLIVPVSMRLVKSGVVLVVVTYIIYQVGEIELLGRFMTGLGVAGLAASLAAQDAMKSFFGTLLLIGERAFKIGDRILVGGTEGVVAHATAESQDPCFARLPPRAAWRRGPGRPASGRPCCGTRRGCGPGCLL